MRKLVGFFALFLVILLTNACGDKKSENQEVSKTKQLEKEVSKKPSAREISENAKNSEIQLEFSGFIDRSYDDAIDVVAQELVKGGPLMISITFDSPEEGGGSLAITVPEIKEGNQELTGEAMQAASVATGKYIFKSTSGTLTISTISDGFIEGTLSHVVFGENTNSDAGKMELVSGSFKIPFKKR